MVSAKCCNEMKKKPTKNTHYKFILGTMAEESQLRTTAWLANGCNAYEGAKPKSQPLSFWIDQDILQYIKKYNVPICSVYGDIVGCEGEIFGQESLFELFGLPEKLCTTGCRRTGCMFCLYGMHLEKGENRIQRLHRTHPKIYDYIMGGGEFDENGLWKPTAKGLGFKFVMDEVNRVMGKEIYKY